MFSEKERYLIAGLGNPGSKYQNTRHNMGFIVLDSLADDLGISIDRAKHKALMCETKISGKSVILAKPQTFMNLSGDSVSELVRFYKIRRDHIMVVYDDLDIPAGTIRIRKKGSAGTHNGMRSVVSRLGYDDFPRMRIGIGSNGGTDIINYVIGGFSEDEKEPLARAVSQAVRALKSYVVEGLDKAMNRYNGKC